MGSIKDATSAPAEGSLHCEITEDEEHPGATGSSRATEEPQMSPGPNQEVTQSRLTQNEVTVPPQSSANSQNTCKSKEMDEGTENILSESSVLFSPLPCSPAPSGQHHIRTQVSLEVVQCQSVATSPMTPPQGDNAFVFPTSSGRSPGATKDAGQQVGQQVEYRSVATAPMTPKTPTSASFPELTEENTRGDVETGSKLEWTPAVKDTTAMDVSEATNCVSTIASPKSSVDCPPIGSVDSKATQQDSRKQSKQHTHKMGSMDQDITILVTHHGTLEESEEGGLHSSFRSIELEVKIDECNEINAPSTEATPMDEVPTANTNEGENFDSHHEQEALTTETQIKIKHESSSLPTSEPHQTETDPLAKDKQSTNSEVKATEEESFGEELEKVPQPESSMTPNPVPSSPAPSGFQHIRTQVSLEVVQCHSVATSPMTPPQGDNVFFFPTSSGHSGATGPETKDAELQVGRQVEYRSVATAPMTPKTPTSATFPEISRKETEQMRENTSGGVELGWTGHVSQDDSTVIESAADSDTGSKSEWTPAVKDTTAMDVPEATNCVSTTASPKSSVDCPPIGSVDLQTTLQDSRKQSKQHTQKMGSIDQDITILVTHHDTLEESEEHTDSFLRSIELDVKIDECNEINAPSTEAGGEAMKIEGDQKKEAPTDEVPTANTNEGKNFDSGHEQEAPTTDTHTNIKHESSSPPISEPPLTAKDHLAKDKKSTKSGAKATEDKSFTEQLEKSSQPESSVTPNPVPSGFQHIQTQVSLEVVQCHSVATSPMTPPQGDNAFFFPTSSGATGPETKDHERQADRQVEFRSVATGPMTPRTPTAPPSFQEISPEKKVEERIAEEEQDKDVKETMSTETVVEDKEEVECNGKDKAKVEEDRKVEAAAEKQTAIASKEKCEEKCEEPVQKVNWDEKGMTWEVYGAVVEVAVLGSAIQKHLEKQVKKHRNQPSMPPPPPLIPTAVPLTSASPPASASGKRGSRKGRAGKRGRRRQNPFRLLLRNMQQPVCCSRAHAAE